MNPTSLLIFVKRKHIFGKLICLHSCLVILKANSYLFCSQNECEVEREQVPQILGGAMANQFLLQSSIVSSHMVVDQRKRIDQSFVGRIPNRVKIAANRCGEIMTEADYWRRHYEGSAGRGDYLSRGRGGGDSRKEIAERGGVVNIDNGTDGDFMKSNCVALDGLKSVGLDMNNRPLPNLSFSMTVVSMNNCPVPDRGKHH